MRLALSTVVLSFLVSSASARAQAPGGGNAAVITPTDSNIVYGNVANASLLMDVFRPSQPNGIGIIFISGSGWGGPGLGGAFGYIHAYDDAPLRKDARLDSRMAGILVRDLVERGYTVFSIDHRFIPETKFPALFYDAQRAVRFIRASAARYGINPDKLGALGHSTGAHLAAMLGVKDTVIDNPKNLPYQRGSSQVQAVVALAAPLVFGQFKLTPEQMKLPPEKRVSPTTPVLGPVPEPNEDGTFPMTGAIAAASPITFVTAHSAPMLMYQAENDRFVVKEQATLMAARLAEAGVPYELRMRTSGGHAPAWDLDEIDAWFRRYLK
jgi:acetyl esterase/lipase